MNSFLFFLFLAVPHIILAAPQAAGSGGDGASGGPLGGLGAFLPLIAIFAIFYFLIIRPQSKKQKETQKMLSALKKGDKIVTIGGIHGVIQSIRENTVIVRVDENTKLEFSRSAVSNVESPGKEEKTDKTDKTDKIEDKKSGEKRLLAPSEDKDEENDGEK